MKKEFFITNGTTVKFNAPKIFCLFTFGTQRRLTAMFRLMMDRMVAKGHYSKVVYSIVSFYAIDMMDKLIFAQRSFYRFFHNVSVFKNIFTIFSNPNFYITFLGESLSRFIVRTSSVLTDNSCKLSSSFTRLDTKLFKTKADFLFSSFRMFHKTNYNIYQGSNQGLVA